MTARVLIQSAPKPNAAFPPTLLMLHIKFDQDWLIGLFESVCIEGIFWGLKCIYDLIQPTFKLVQDFMPVLVTSKFNTDPIKNEHASLETAFSPL